ncbi:MAG: membrane associated rhomboid family serine protease [Planctomycetota bacterium]|jgi:membrane associated rhomboid family serine protease
MNNLLQRTIKYWRFNEPNWVVIILIVNLAFFAASLLASNPQHHDGIGPSGEALYLLGSSVFHLIADGQLHRLIVANFLHGGLMHVAMNCFVLWQLGPMTQRILGANRFLTLYILTGITGTLLSLGWKFYSSDFAEPWQLVGSIGASTSMFGLMGFLLIWSRRTPGFDGLARQLMFWLFINVAISFQIPFIDNAGHAGGFLGGVGMAYLVHSRRRSMLQTILLHKRATATLGIVTVICFLAVPIVYFGNFGQTCRVLYQARPNVLVAIDTNSLDSRLLTEAADEVKELRESLADDFPVDLSGLEAQIRQAVFFKKLKVGVFDNQRQVVAKNFNEFVLAYCRYLGHTSRLTYLRR